MLSWYPPTKGENSMKKLIALIATAVTLMGCENAVQTTSGGEYLAKYKNVPVGASSGDSASGGKNINQLIRDAAAVEPVLKFPARIGLARIENGDLAPVPQEEAEAWKKAQEKLGSGFGEFVLLSPMVVKMVAAAVGEEQGYYGRGIEGVITAIRLGAARQHLDAVVIYEEHSTEEEKDNLLSVGKLSLIGGFILPSESHEAQGFADGMLIDVIQGYPYGTLQTVVDKQTKLASAWGWGSDRSQALSEKVKIQAGKQFAQQATDMFMKLRTGLAEKRAK